MDKQRNYTISNTTFQTHKTDTNQTSKICTYIKLVKWLELLFRRNKGQQHQIWWLLLVALLIY